MQPIIDAGVFSIMLIIAFASMAFYSKFGALILLIPILTFLIAGLVILTGNDVAFFKFTNPANVTTTSKNSSLLSTSSTITTMKIISTSNETDYLIGNGQFPITGLGQLWMGYSLIILAVLLGVVFLDQTLKGNLVRGD